MLKENVALIVPKQNKDPSGCGFITQNIMGHKTFSAYDINYCFPLFLYEGYEKKSNLMQSFKVALCSENNEMIFNYIYGVLQLPRYCKKYSSYLKTDFPRIPLPSQILEAGLLPSEHKNSNSTQIFETVSNFGKELRELHLLTHAIFEDKSKWGVKVEGEKPEKTPDWQVALVKYNPSENRVHVNNDQYFEGIEPEVWAYHIGGYQVLEKWLKDRKKAERCLSTDDLLHYMKIVVSLRETIRLTKQFE